MHTMTKAATMSAALAAALTLSACQSTPSSPVIQRANAIYETTGLGSTKVKAQQNALDSAKNTCRSRQVIVVNDELTYNGILDERAGRVVGQVGAVVGSIFGTGSPNLSRDDDFEYNISFRCQ